MLKKVKFSELKKNAGFTFTSTGPNGPLYVKIDKVFARGEHNQYKMNSGWQVWADDSQIKPWWKLW